MTGYRSHEEIARVSAAHDAVYDAIDKADKVIIDAMKAAGNADDACAASYFQVLLVNLRAAREGLLLASLRAAREALKA